ncbi:thioredoxin [bacterium]|nr:thioredoxin [bacterium]
MVKPLEIKDATFDSEVLKSDIPVMVDFWAPWCVPCRAVAPIIEELAGDYEGKIKVCKVNTDENQRISAMLNIRSIPTIAFFLNGQVQDVIVGARPKKNFEKAIEAIIQKSIK